MYTVTGKSGLHIQNVAGSKAGSMTVLPCGAKARNYESYAPALLALAYIDDCFFS